MTAQERFTAVALVAQNGKILHAKGYGMASPGRPNTVDTVFHVASITKQFTADAETGIESEEGMKVICSLV